MKKVFFCLLLCIIASFSCFSQYYTSCHADVRFMNGKDTLININQCYTFELVEQGPTQFMNMYANSMKTKEVFKAIGLIWRMNDGIAETVTADYDTGQKVVFKLNKNVYPYELEVERYTERGRSENLLSRIVYYIDN